MAVPAVLAPLSPAALPFSLATRLLRGAAPVVAAAAVEVDVVVAVPPVRRLAQPPLPLRVTTATAVGSSVGGC